MTWSVQSRDGEGRQPMLEWMQVSDSERVVAVAYDEESERIHVQFPDGARWWYAGCPRQTWEEFTMPGTSKGQYIHRVLNSHSNGQSEA